MIYPICDVMMSISTWDGAFLNISFEPQLIALFALLTCSNYSITNYVEIPVFHFFEKVNQGHLKMVNVNY